MTATRRLWFLAIGGVAVVGVLALHYKDRDSYRCQSCWAEKDVFQWRLGSWSAFSIPITPSWERTSETRFQRDFFAEDHVHNWMFAQGSPYYFFGAAWGGCAIGGGRHVTELCQMYESDPEFRDFLGRKLRDGSLSRSNFVAMTSAQRTGEPSPLKKDADALLEVFLHDSATRPNPALKPAASGAGLKINER